MKKTILAVIVPTLLATGAANAAEIYKAEDGSVLNMYGRVEANFVNKDTYDAAGHKDSDTDGSVYARLGFNGRQVVNENMAVIGQAQYQLSQEPGSSDTNWNARYVWAGLDMADAGRVEAGRVASGLIMFTDIGDIFYAGGDVVAGANVNTVDSGAALVFRQDGTFQYRNSVGGLDFSAAYITNSSIDYGFNTAARYNIELGDMGMLAPVAMYQFNKADTQSKAVSSVKEYQTYGIGAQYFYGDFYAGATYVEEKFDAFAGGNDKTKGTDAVVAYDFGQFVTRAGYRYQDLKDAPSSNKKIQDRWTIEGQYKLTAQSSIFANYSYNEGHGVTGADLVNAAGSLARKEGGVASLGLRYEW
ncbi:porin [Motilimonas cestriensis]|uniref:Porin n=1 Tax=Motilimonas cestriensis TaxID=2742685 RepID=A0ABS8WEE0_9GAMM|nr:porin [Motilimonas cestriensis]MCE2595715.1 porin [Motilimonas cestriensis]